MVLLRPPQHPPRIPIHLNDSLWTDEAEGSCLSRAQLMCLQVTVQKAFSLCGRVHLVVLWFHVSVVDYSLLLAWSLFSAEVHQLSSQGCF